MRSLLVIADGNPQIGFGHLKREADLVNALQARSGWRAHLATTGSSPEAVSFFHALSPGTQHLGLPGDDGLPRALERVKPDLVIVDVLGERLEPCGAAASACGALSLGVGDWTEPRATRTALLLNANPRDVERKQAFYAAAGVEALLGPSYFMAAPSLRHARAAQTNGSSRPMVREVLVALGGGDLTNVLERTVLEALRPVMQARGLRVRVMVSPVTGLGEESVARLAAAGFGVLRAVRDIQPLLQSTDLLIGSHGNIAYESAVLGVPMIAVNLGVCQQEQSEEMARLGAVVDAGLGERLEVESFRQLVEQVLDDRAGRERMAAARRALVDGRGLERVMDALERRWVTSGERG